MIVWQFVLELCVYVSTCGSLSTEKTRLVKRLNNPRVYGIKYVRDESQAPLRVTQHRTALADCTD